jgi:hypothetical protein
MLDDVVYRAEKDDTIKYDSMQSKHKPYGYFNGLAGLSVGEDRPDDSINPAFSGYNNIAN